MIRTMDYHNPVMASESLELLQPRSGGIYVDATLGGGGHARLLLERLGEGQLYGFDQDPDAVANAPEDPRFTLVRGNFRHLRKLLRLQGLSQIDGLLADFGVSSHQFDTGARGFSIRHEAPLDMRMNPERPLHAAAVVNDYERPELMRILRDYGEIQRPGKIVSALEKQRPISTTGDLREALLPLAPRQRENRFLAQVFQAIRIEVNEELKAIEELLEQSTGLLRPGGRVVCLSYHSLEDRLVKNFFRYGNTQGQPQKDFYGKLLRPLEPLTRKPLVPADAELEENPRARSVKLRAAAKPLSDAE